MIARLRPADGYAVATAMIVMSLMLTIGIAAFAFVDTETESSRRERTHEARLNLTEGVIAAEIFHMSRRWPQTAERAYPDSCTEGSADDRCPQPAQLKSHFSAVDFELDPQWEVKVRDDVTDAATGKPIQFYDDAAVQARPTYDENGNGEMWVRAEGLLKVRKDDPLPPKKRIVVARVRVEKRPLRPPAAPFVAGKFNTGNNAGSKVIVETTPGVYGVVRCDNGGDPADHVNGCIDYGNGQMSPVNMVKSDINAGAAIPEGMQDALKQMAKDAGTYYESGCPANPSGLVVWVENGNCSYNGNMTVNGTTKKGIFIINNGTLTIAGTLTWWGVIYALNGQNCGATTTGCLTAAGYQDTVVSVTGTPTIHGGVFVDGDGRLSLGNSGNAGGCANCLPTLMYDPTVVLDLTAFGTAGIIQNTWRELNPATQAAAAG